MKTQLPRSATILGAAKSGLAAATYLRSKGVSLFLSDTMEQSALAGVLGNAGLSGIAFEGNAHSDRCLQSECIILSPGIPAVLPLLIEARNRGIPVWSEIELAFNETAATIVALTGSSGKSTTVSLCGAALNAGGKNAVVAGNIGVAAISKLPQLSDSDIAVLEVSSFQLETIEHFKPAVAGIINLMKNHLDRYSDEHAYYAAKRMIAANMGRSDLLVLNADDPILTSWVAAFAATTQVAFFGVGKPSHRGVYIVGNTLVSTMDESEKVILDLREMKLVGMHNWYNAAAAAALALGAGAHPANAMQGMCTFTGLPHRLEYVDTITGVAFYNDSKSTTAESIQCAIRAFNGNVHLIAGGRDKGCEFEILQSELAQRVREVILIGEASDRIAIIFDGLVPVVKASSLDNAMALSLANASIGDVVVFSPGCSSFDMFKNYEHRGEVFRQIVARLKARAGDAS